MHTGLLVNNLVWVGWDPPVWCAQLMASLATHTGEDLPLGLLGKKPGDRGKDQQKSK